MVATKESIHQALRHYFGFDAFKGKQEDIIKSVLAGKDTFVIMPTGGGKSLCYQLPALMMEGTAIIISPLIALMKNQVDAIRAHSQQEDVAHFLNSSLNRAQIKKVKDDIVSGVTKLLYVAPETLTKEENLEFFRNTKVSFVAVDEAHCISEWGHDFRPEYRRIRTMIETLGDKIPIIALTATATPKVRADVVKSLDMEYEATFLESFNRDNLFYEVRPKAKPDQLHKTIIQFIKNNSGKSGIIYVQARQTAEDLAKLLSVNDIKAQPYHAGLDPKVRANTQDDFLMGDIDVIVATIAFGMGIDKPDIRFVIHYDMPKSIENYYQETGRAGRDGLEGKCVGFYSYKDMLRLEKFLRDKPVSEREMGMLLLNDVIAYTETSSCRRRYLLHYFGENYGNTPCKMCDNCAEPKPLFEAKDELITVLNSIQALQENYGMKHIIEFITGVATKPIIDYEHNKQPLFGKGKEKDDAFWNSVIQKALLDNLIFKDIETYGLLKLTPEGRQYVQSPTSFMVSLNHDHITLTADEAHEASLQQGSSALDPVLLSMLKDLLKQEAKKRKIPPFVIFQEPSLEDMATQYPVNLEEMCNITGVSRGKAIKFAKPFFEMIAKYVEENDVDRPSDFVVKSVGERSQSKVALIKSIDKRIPLAEICRSQQLKMDDLLTELESIVLSGTKINLDYHIEEHIDESVQEIIYDYFIKTQMDSPVTAYHALKGEDITIEEIQIMRLKLYSEYN
jgi:ATP-dependent DNA helicase RecQ